MKGETMKLNRLSLSAKIALHLARMMLALMLALANLLVVPLATAQQLPTIASDLPDYNPGQRVTLTGAGWDGDTTVTITVVDAVPTVYHDTDQVQVQPDGTISDSFNLPSTFIDQYFVT